MNSAILKYRDALEDAAGDKDRFEAVYGALESDRSINADGIKALALAMTGIKPNTKTDALQLIRLGHEAIVGSRARARAIGGRTAA